MAADRDVGPDLEVGPAQLVFDLFVALPGPVPDAVDPGYLGQVCGRVGAGGLTRAAWPGQVGGQVSGGLVRQGARVCLCHGVIHLAETVGWIGFLRRQTRAVVQILLAAGNPADHHGLQRLVGKMAKIFDRHVTVGVDATGQHRVSRAKLERYPSSRRRCGWLGIDPGPADARHPTRWPSGDSFCWPGLRVRKALVLSFGGAWRAVNL
jgi:hypothetical protein